jgi:hypothetical protein
MFGLVFCEMFRRPRLTGAAYRRFFFFRRTIGQSYWKLCPLDILRKVRFVHDRAPSHFRQPKITLRLFATERLEDKQGPVSCQVVHQTCSLRSLSLGTSKKMWRKLQQWLLQRYCSSSLKMAVILSAAFLKCFQLVCQSTYRRDDACVVMRDQHFDHLLQH